MAPVIPKEVQLLIDTYTKAQIRLVKIIEQANIKGNVTAYSKAVLAQVNAELNTLNTFTKDWAAKSIAETYGASVNAAYSKYRATNLSISAQLPQASRVQNLVDNMVGSLEDVTKVVGRRVSDALRQAALDAAAEGMATGGATAATRSMLMQNLIAQGVSTILDKNGKPINMNAYASMVARTTVREATNRGTMDAVQSVGRDLVQMSQHFSSCELCSEYEGRVYSITGGDDRYPSINEAFGGGYDTIHPNCGHVLEPYIEEMDPNFDKTLEYSNRPFEPDPEKAESVAAYNRQQAAKAVRRSERKAWEQGRINNPGGTPKTFSGYRSQLRAQRAKAPTAPEKTAKPTKPAAPAPIQSVSQVTNMQELESYIQKNFNIDLATMPHPDPARALQGERISEISTLDFELMKNNFATLEKFDELNPDLHIFDRFNVVGIDRAGVMNVDWSWTTPDKLRYNFNPHYFGEGNRENLERALVNGPIVGHWPKGITSDSFIMHEVGHGVDFEMMCRSHITKFGSVTPGSVLPEWGNKIGTEFAKSTVTSAMKEFRHTYMAKGETLNLYQFRSAISRYAATNHTECLAEALNEVWSNGDKASKQAQLVVKYMGVKVK